MLKITFYIVVSFYLICFVCVCCSINCLLEDILMYILFKDFLETFFLPLFCEVNCKLVCMALVKFWQLTFLPK